MNPLAGKRPLGPIAGTSCALVAVALAGPFLREVFMGVGAQPVAQLMPLGAQDLGDFPGLAPEAEFRVLRYVESHVAEHPDGAFSMRWRELDSPYGGHLVATYDPRAHSLHLWLDERNVVSYAPMTLPGIRRTLRRGSNRGSFASARADSLALAGR
jgi:hypothetical protein